MGGDQLGSKFPPGFRFHPSDEELIVHYLQNKISSRPLPASIIAEIDLYKYNPWELPKKELFGEDEWYFFSPRDRKYPNGLRPNRAAASGYCKATGTDKPIIRSCGSKRIGVKKALVFYRGRPPNGSKTDWNMKEYRLIDTATKPSGFKGSMRLDEWVLCRVRHRGYSLKNTCENQDNPRGPNLLPNLPWSEESPSNMVTDFQYKDYKILASILVGEHVLPTDILSNLSFKGNSLNSVYEQGSTKMNSHITIPSLDSYLDTLNEDIQCGNLISSNWKLNIENRVLINSDIDCNNQNQSQHGILNESPPDPTISFQVTGRYRQ